MSDQTEEGRIQLALGAIQKSKKLKLYKAAATYGVPYKKLRSRMNGKLPRSDCRPNSKKLTKIEEEVIIKHILDLEE